MAAAAAAAAAGPAEEGEAAAELGAAAAATVLAEKLSLARLADAAAELLDQQQQQHQQQRKQQQQQQVNPWLLLRRQQLPLAAAAVRPTAAAAAQQLRLLLQNLKRMQNMPQQRRQLLLLLSSSQLLQQQLPRVAQLLQTQRLLPLYMQPKPCSSSSSSSKVADPSGGSFSQLKYPPPNVVVALPGGGAIEGSARLLKARLYHPSWLWQQQQQQQQSAAAAFAAGSFESPARYVLQTAAAAAAATSTKQKALLSPSILTQERMRALLSLRFGGGLKELDEMLDSFFMGFMGKLASRSTDIMNGKCFLYRFPRNGFASMIKTGAKGSNVNYAMICVFLGQQSLEGRRVQPMSSGKSLPAFAAADFGSLARGFVLSSFLTGLREEEFYFHCMAGREGLIDTAVKTAKSGYLQRSLVKSLEGLRLAYDGSVRDSDNSILQFVYADDGLDPAAAAALQHMQ
ncbi:hypothetical protein, conserved [Eimeria tenella]|uniref:DNA-directed RNA polymerase n=1 Tax=Eimeria tenella TaxID=5802 RepID=U6KS07_EIMTE|nr:hypothetical protein, conserved [Eimeria tenella]CDJ40897.1 hypothetical protein, conserved [Eimeria tenella]|eukprot:XP_013231647.1 hypothetical protein, conserved [Eimeria tenella]